jgi:hypothetical protein
MKKADPITRVRRIDEEWSYFISQVPTDPDFMEDYAIVIMRLVGGDYSWMYCGHCRHPDEAEEIARSAVERFKRHPADWENANLVVTAPAKEAMLKIAVDAAAGGHDLSGFGLVLDPDGEPNGYQAQCRQCDQTVWVGFDGLMYSLLSDSCPNKDSSSP